MHIKSLATFATLTLFLQNIAHAELTTSGQIISDSISGLEWLNVRNVNDYSYEAIQNGAGGYIQSGWRYATKAEVIDLATHYVGLQNGLYVSPASGLSAEYEANAEATVIAFGMNLAFNDSRAIDNVTSIPSLHQISIQGMYDDGDSTNASHGVFEITAVLSDGSGTYGPPGEVQPFGRWAAIDNSQPPYMGTENMSNFLVRSSPVPEPTSLSLLFLGTMLLGALQRRRVATA